jgi:3-oxoacyl-[acyl-carrier protein] reductase
MLNNGELTVEKFEEYCKKSYPLRRIGEPEDIADAIAFISSDKASFITGALIPVDGGSVHDSPMIETSK